jgi:hypothetical protein
MAEMKIGLGSALPRPEAAYIVSFLILINLGTALPLPPQLLHFVYPVCAHELQPTSPSDHRVHMHAS